MTCGALSSVAAYAGFECGEGFAVVDALGARGWQTANNSVPLGTTGWSQGDPAIFEAWAGAPNSYVAADADNAGAGAQSVVSNWLITPEIDFGPNSYNVRIFDFFTRAVPGAANRVVVRVCLESETERCDAPQGAPTELGGFSTTLLSINPDLAVDGYPAEWTEYTLTPADGLPVVGRGRIAFHYSVPLQLDGTHGTYIGIDAVTMAGATECPFTDVLLVNGFD
ncbi:MAG TPA: choice-of-anchor J domain-containing protein [Rhodanobacteraceae bacterium]|nr:choice-of-anchor J domain-containing protein [Rhodanobacteraceae bacterium]